MPFENLKEYTEEYKRHEGCSTKAGYLPKLVIYFRKAFDALGMDDSQVPDFFSWNDEIAEDFLTWGHNSRWANTFNMMLLANLNNYVNDLKAVMAKENIRDFKITYDE